jgi:hypothetical protein
MSASQCVRSQDFARENLASPNDRPAEKSVLSPFSGNLCLDEELILSNKNFKQRIGDFFRDKDITHLSQLTATPAFPTPHVLAQFANKAYTDYERRETDAQYETRLALPDGWKLLTTASSYGNNNGYFGAAYWHPEHQQVVIAHRGTKLTNVGAIFTDLIGVLFKHHVPQMESASTFAHKVVEVLRDLDHEKGTNFQVFFTGHSLGGWLAQITTFTTEYLKTEGDIFLKSKDDQKSYHPHTVVFDSPGCKDMLSQMAVEFYVRHDRRSIDIEHLDITSYLSAPNLINTCNAHVGTVYRIFVDLSDMGWLEKHTALYNLATHSMDRIVETFDPKTGQVRKVEQEKLKVQVVIDWPISSFQYDDQYNTFFKWAEHFNDYHPDTTDKTLQLKGCLLIRYQTKNYDGHESSLSTFSLEEQQFLELYRWLRESPEFYRPEELFSAIQNNEAQDKAVTILQSFEIESDKMRCTDASALQALIPYVKRLLQLFPEVSGNIRRVFTSHGIRSRVYQFETRCYIEQINQSPLDFKAEALSLGDFLSSDQQRVLQLQMTDGDEWTGLVKAYQVLQKANCLREGQYTVMKLKRLLTLNKLIDFGALMLSTGTPHLILVAWEANRLLNGEEEDIIRTLFNTIKRRPSIKLILSTRSENSTYNFLRQISKETLGKGFVRTAEQLTWSDITTSSQEKLLNTAVSFQGTDIALNKLILADSPLVKLLPLDALLEGKKLKIGDPVLISDTYNECYFIGRTFRHQIAMKEDIFSDERKITFPDLVANTEGEFKQLSELIRKNNVHWVETDKSGNIFWQQSQGRLETLRKYIDTDSSPTYTPGDLDKLLEQAHKQRVMLISDTAGMGKSTVLTHLSKQIKQKFPAKWVVRVDLNDHTDALNALQEELQEKQISKEKAIEFTSEKILKLKLGFETELFKQCCEQKQKVDVVIMLDGFDEISPNYKETVIDLLQALRQTAVEQLWVTTRPHLREELEDKLQQLSYTLEPFSGDNQVEFLKKFWSLKDWFTEVQNEEEEGQKEKLEFYAKELVRKLAQSICDKDKEFTGIPLQCRMLAEAFDEEVKTYCQSVESVPKLQLKLDLIGLYAKFIKSKYDIYQKYKFQVRINNVIAKEQRARDLRNMTEDHQLLALKVLFTEEQVTLLLNYTQCTFSAKQLEKIGIVQISQDDKLHFIHRTFAEYYVAEFFVNQLTEGKKTTQQVQDVLLEKTFVVEDYRVIRAFIDGLLSGSKPSNEVLKQYGNRVRDLWADGVPVLHQAARDGDAHIIGFVLDSVRAAGHTDTFYEMLLGQDHYGRTAWQEAAECGNVQVLDKFWEYAREELLIRKCC